MIPITEYAGRDVAVYGLGRTGLAAARALKAGKAKVHAWDDNEASRAKAEAEGIPVSDLNKRDWQNFAALVLSPGIPLTHPQPHRLVRLAQMTNVPVVGDMELFARAVQSLPERGRPKIIGITGTNGKSTTTALIGHILKECGLDVHVGGNIGTGVLDLPALSANAYYVLELSSYQLDLTKSLHCDVSVLLNMSPDHLDRHGDMDGYVAAKKRIFRNQGRGDTAVIGIDDHYTQAIAMGLAGSGEMRLARISSEFALGRGVSAVDGKLFDSLSNNAVRVGDLGESATLPGRHNWQNAAAAYAACRALGLDPGRIFGAILTFPGLAHRMEQVGEIDGVRFVNDSKATNAQLPMTLPVRSKARPPMKAAARWTRRSHAPSRTQRPRARKIRSCFSHRPAPALISSRISRRGDRPSVRRLKHLAGMPCGRSCENRHDGLGRQHGDRPALRAVDHHRMAP